MKRFFVVPEYEENSRIILKIIVFCIVNSSKQRTGKIVNLYLASMENFLEIPYCIIMKARKTIFPYEIFFPHPIMLKKKK